ncbi:hypothetical protein ABB27_15890 [Stenotrophomonas terrae]|uniref:Uncharacterized protein n=1 Tax=Stenotrophomonas terrae TaxID=405446 RepID=A0A0R0C6G3_9GAMM|nr:hypothetical protein ABB27_15890 [Stenotrophomonas terrae]
MTSIEQRKRRAAGTRTNIKQHAVCYVAGCKRLEKCQIANLGQISVLQSAFVIGINYRCIRI